MLRASDDTLWASTPSTSATPGIFDISAGGDFAGAVPWVEGGGWGMAEEALELLVVHPDTDTVRAFDGGGPIESLPIFASGMTVPASIDATGIGLLATTAIGGSVWDVSAGGDFSGAMPYATGLGYVFGLVHVAAPVCGDGWVDAGEECDDTQETAACDDDCTLAVCGDGTTNTAAGEECDDGNMLSGDGCAATCTAEEPGGTESESMGADYGDAGDSEADGTSRGEPTSDGASDSAMSETPSSASGADSDGLGGTDTDGAANTGGARGHAPDGCVCRAQRERSTTNGFGLGLLALAAAAARRRRVRAG